MITVNSFLTRRENTNYQINMILLLRRMIIKADHYRVLGIMSGTSLDGVDLACCSFAKNDSSWKFEITDAVTVGYSNEWFERLSTLHSQDGLTLAITHVEYGRFLGDLAAKFIREKKLKVDFISSHGHTIFHQPVKKLTLQIGEGAALSASGGLPVVCDFRSQDVALGGQGAPLVPIGDELLFSEFDFCLNLGGIANISFKVSENRFAFDVVPCNLVLNDLAGKLNKKYDDEGLLGASGKVNDSLLNQLNDFEYYQKKIPKSLGREDVEKLYFPLLSSQRISVEDKLATFCEHIAFQISKVIEEQKLLSPSESKLLITGGGALNKFLVKRIEDLSSVHIIIPDRKIIEFKEALIFAFLGVLRWRNEINTLKSVTGATSDHSAGAIYL